MRISFTDFTTIFSKRDGVLGQPATEADIINFNKLMGLVLHTELQQFYKTCSGLEVPDVWLISLWPLEKIKRVRELDTESHIFSIGDFMLDSEEIITDITNPNSPIMLRSSNHELSSSFNELLGNLVSGQLELNA